VTFLVVCKNAISCINIVITTNLKLALKIIFY
jgi:hypothetical protein